MRIDTKILDLHKKGLEPRQIAVSVGRSVATVYNHLKAYAQASGEKIGPAPAVTVDIDKIDARWVLEKMALIALGTDDTAGPSQIAALKAILDMLRAKETMPAEMSLSEKLEWLKKMMTPDEFLAISEGWPADDRRKIYDRFAQEFQTNIDATNGVQ